MTYQTYRRTKKLSKDSVITAVAEHATKRIVRKVVLALQKLGENSLLSGDDSGLTNVWDEICVQVQYEQSFYWSVYDQVVRGEVEYFAKQLLPYEREAIWLETEAGWDWLFDDEDDRDAYPVCDDDIVGELVKHVYGEASNYTNRRIRDHLERAWRSD